jgi:hypothetical protein
VLSKEFSLAIILNCGRCKVTAFLSHHAIANIVDSRVPIPSPTHQDSIIDFKEDDNLIALFSLPINLHQLFIQKNELNVQLWYNHHIEKKIGSIEMGLAVLMIRTLGM